MTQLRSFFSLVATRGPTTTPPRFNKTYTGKDRGKKQAREPAAAGLWRESVFLTSRFVGSRLTSSVGHFLSGIGGSSGE
jgi:hypothetical protein